jgi:CRP/FNR family cyclic AMP-dependent transcriptional regulator
MVSGPTAMAPQIPLEDPLAHLPCSSVLEYQKGQVIYDRNQPSANIYLVIEGKVKVSHLTNDGHEVIVDIYRTDDFFGESAFLSLAQRSEEARAFEDTKVMAWTAAEIEGLAAKQPRLAVALLQVLAQRNIDLTQRIESFSIDDISRRLARTLIRLAERMGTTEHDGSIRLIPLTHELLSQYVGTSREVVTLHMNRFRRQGYLRYSRKSMILYPSGFQDWLKEERTLGGSSAS